MGDTSSPGRILGSAHELLALGGVEPIREVSADLVRQARRELRIFTRDLDARIYDQQDFLDAVKGLALNSSQSRIRILLQDDQPAVKNGHRLIEIARRLTSSIAIRIPIAEYRHHAASFLVADSSGYVYRELSTVYEATADYHGPLEAQPLIAFFDEVWERSLPDPELRRLYL